ncbi:hypothetical protein [Streptomyces sp. NPDC002671]
MSTESEYGAGAYGAHRPVGSAEGLPNVYHPQQATAPSYEEYADPAAAHGWQNAYDETRNLPPVPPADAYPEADAYPDTGADADAAAFGGPGEGHGRADRRRQRRRGGRRRVAVAAGALGVVCAGVAVIAGLADSGSSSGPRSDGRPSTSGGAPDTASARPDAATPGAADGSPEVSASAAAPATGTPTGGAASSATGQPTSVTTSPAAKTSEPATPTATPTVSATTVAPDGPGNGRGHRPPWKPK